MSWNIECVRNTVKVDAKTAKAITKDIKQTLEYEGYVFENGLFVSGVPAFPVDAMEHSDYFRDFVIESYNKHNVLGDVCFGSLEGDNRNTFWGYRFYGDGSYSLLKGTIHWDITND